MAVRKVSITIEGEGESGQAEVMRLLEAIASSLALEREARLPPRTLPKQTTEPRP